MINPAPDFWPIFDPLGPTAGPGILGTGFGSKNIAGCTKNQVRRSVIRPVRGYFVFRCRAQKDQKINDKSEAPQISPDGPKSRSPAARPCVTEARGEFKQYGKGVDTETL